MATTPADLLQAEGLAETMDLKLAMAQAVEDQAVVMDLVDLQVEDQAAVDQLADRDTVPQLQLSTQNQLAAHVTKDLLGRNLSAQSLT